MATNYTYLTLIVSDQKAAQAVSSDQYFLTELSETGKAPATNYMSSGPFENTEVDAIVNGDFFVYVRSDNWQDAIDGLGLKIING